MATQGENPTTEEGSVHIIEYYLENGLFSLRWLLVPLYVGLGLLLILFSVYFFRELLHLFAGAATGEEVDLILGALTLVDLTLVGSLIVMVMLSGYENFVSKSTLELCKNHWHGSANSMQDRSRSKWRRRLWPSRPSICLKPL